MSRGGRGERESQAGPTLSAEPKGGSISRPWDHDPSQNQESDAQPTKPPGRPIAVALIGISLWMSDGEPVSLCPVAICVFSSEKGLDERTKEMCHVPTVEYYSALRKERNPAKHVQVEAF